MKPWLVGALGLAVAGLVIAPCIVEYRSLYGHHKRLRTVTPDKFYRSGQLTQAGFREAIGRLGIRTVINVQDEYPDPQLERSYWDRSRASEKALCAELGVRYVFLAPDLQPERNDDYAKPSVLSAYLQILDNPASYPVLLHCKAGLHRTGVLTAVYRMEYEGWSAAAAADELRGHGFGNAACTCANDYVRQYVLNYRPRRSSVRSAE